MTGAEGALLAMVLLPGSMGAALALTRRWERVATPIAVATAGLTTALAAVVALARPALSAPFVAGADFALEVDALAALTAPMIAAPPPPASFRRDQSTSLPPGCDTSPA